MYSIVLVSHFKPQERLSDPTGFLLFGVEAGELSLGVEAKP